MIADYRDGVFPAEIEADICIAGAGAAGIAMAHALANTSLNLCILESGGLVGEHRNQQLYEGSSIGCPPFDPGTSRMRAFGGSCNLWGGGCIPLSNLDLTRRDWVPHSGWPLTYAELQPHYKRALAFCRIGDHDFTAGSFLTPLSRPPPSFDARKLINQTYVTTPIVFGTAYRRELERATNIKILLHANLLELQVSADGSHIQRAAIGSLDGRKSTVRARHYVLACGGIENARLLLLSNSTRPHGLGNDRDLVGRFFMDHPSGKLGAIFSDASDRIARPYNRELGKGRVPPYPEIGLSEQAQKTHRLLCARIHPFAVEGPVPKGLQALRQLRATLHKPVDDENSALAARLCAATSNGPNRSDGASTLSERATRLALQAGLGVNDIARAFVHKLTDRPTVNSHHVDLVGYFEQAPNPHSRVTLGNETDALGQRKVCVDWRLTALDRHTYRHAAMLCGSELVRICGGVFQPEPWLADDAAEVPQVHGTAHHMGTTRMADSPGEGVVDRHCRVHGIDNLHVAGSSIFPTGSWAFPTLTIVALSLRLAEHLQAHLATRPAHNPTGQTDTA